MSVFNRQWQFGTVLVCIGFNGFNLLVLSAAVGDSSVAKNQVNYPSKPTT